MPAVDVKYLAVIVSAALAFTLGALWYSPVMFGELWMKLNGLTPKKLKGQRQHMSRIYIVTAVTYLVTATVLTLLIAYSGATSALQGAWIGFLTWLGFAATVGLVAAQFSGKSLGAFLLDAGYRFVYLIAMGTILAVWR